MRWWERVGAWDDSRRFRVDAATALVVALVVVPAAYSLSGDSGAGVKLAAALTAVPLAWRRTHPTASAVAIFSVALAHLLLGHVLIAPSDAIVLVALYSVTVYGTPRAYRTALAGALVGTLVLGVALFVDPVLGSFETAVLATVVGGLLILSVFAFALVRRSRRETVESLRDRARRLEVERDQQALIATAAERARIAREMHDIVAHALSVIIAQADGGRYAAAKDSAAATRSLATIAETGRAALTDMRQLLGVLRPAPEGPGAGRTDEEQAPPPGGRRPADDAAATGSGGGRRSTAPAPQLTPQPPAPQLAPQPAVGDLERLVEQVRDSGVPVSLVHLGTSRPLPPGTGLTVYRICQESLTNVLKHAGPACSATVLLQWTTDRLVLQVTDDGRGAAADGDGDGQGVLGMRERAAMLGGSLTIGPRPGGGYRVRAELPIPAAEARP